MMQSPQYGAAGGVRYPYGGDPSHMGGPPPPPAMQQPPMPPNPNGQQQQPAIPPNNMPQPPPQTEASAPEGVRQLVAQTAIVPHVLLVMHAMDHRARTKEEHRFEERVRE